MLSHGELQLPPPPSCPSYVAHSSADRDGGIELDYVSFFYYRFMLSAVNNTNCNVGIFESKEEANSKNMWLFRFIIFVLGSAQPLCYCLLLGAYFAVSSISETVNLLFMVSPVVCHGYTRLT